jgi:hypothetical protein
MACKELIPITECNRLHQQDIFKNRFDNNRTDWQNVHVMDKMMKIVCRASNRIFVVLPLYVASIT